MKTWHITLIKKQAIIASIFINSTLALGSNAQSINISALSHPRSEPISNVNLLSKAHIHSLTGEWSGVFQQNKAPVMWIIRLKLSQKEQQVTGITYREALSGEINSVTSNIKGTSNGKEFQFREIELDNRRIPSWYAHCKVSGTINLMPVNERGTLEGAWKCISKDEQYYGRIRISPWKQEEKLFE